MDASKCVRASVSLFKIRNPKIGTKLDVVLMFLCSWK